MTKLILVLAIASGITTGVVAQQSGGQAGAGSVAANAAPSKSQTGNGQPVTVMLDHSDPSDPLFEVPPLPETKVTLLGGRVTHVDRVRNRLSIEAFGGKKTKVQFDERTHIYRDGAPTTQLGIQKGDRVYVDTQLDGTHVFARNIRVVTSLPPADARGQILQYIPERRVIVVRDELSSQPIQFSIDSDTRITRGDQAGSVAALRPGALIQVRFAPDSASKGLARQVEVIAEPGQTVIFAGEVTHLDMSRGEMAVQNEVDDKSYDIRFDPNMPSMQSVTLGANVTVHAVFDSTGYKVRSVTVHAEKADKSDQS